MNGPAPGAECCPRCGRGFNCGVLDAAPCPCTTVRLDGVRLAQLRSRWSGCLCIACLAVLADGAPLEIGGTRNDAAPVR